MITLNRNENEANSRRLYIKVIFHSYVLLGTPLS